MAGTVDEWIPLREAVVEAAKAYSQFMLCTPQECLEHALARIMSRLQRGISSARAHLWEYSVKKGDVTIEVHRGVKHQFDDVIPDQFWTNINLFADSGVFDWVAGEFSYEFDGPDGTYGRGAAVDVEVFRYGLPLIAGSWGQEEPAVFPRAVSPSFETRGRKRAWNWEGAMCALIAEANTPNGLPEGYGAQAEIGRMLAKWFNENQSGEPAPSEIGLRAAQIMTAIDNSRK